MTKKPFREHHLLSLLEGYERQHLPLDLFLSLYFRSNKALGSKDRAYIAEILYGLVRWKGLLDALCEKNRDWETKLQLYQQFDPNRYQNRNDIPQHVRLSFPKILYDLIVNTHGEGKAKELCLISNRPAPTTVRVNILKTTREAMLEKWSGLYDISPCLNSSNGIVFHKKINFFSLPEFKEGLFEVQDEGSQLLAEHVEAVPGQWVLDFCAGSGGKTLAFAPRMNGKGQIFLHDIRSHALEECRKRLRRAGIQNAQIVRSDDPKLNKLKKKMDWVLADVPCTGTGTMRRNPDMKWNYTADTLPRLIGQQRMIFEKALSFLHPDGRIVYGTCSILKEENEEQIAHFQKTYNLEVEGTFFQSLPSEGGMDGFFCAVLRNKNVFTKS